MITYCTNIHPAESWADTFSSLQTHIPPVKAAVSPGEPFPVGLRLSCRAAAEIDAAESAVFKEWLQHNSCFVPTINGFPYGDFHHTAVKEKVYLPDWRQPERLNYTVKLAELLDDWLPPGVRGSISTVPGGFKSSLTAPDLPLIMKNLTTALEQLDELRQRSGKEIILSLEPEPGCLLETTGDLIGFVERMNLPDNLRQGIGICFDCCHHALQFEDAAASLRQLAAADIPVGKIQISSAPVMVNPSPPLLQSLCEPTWLHQAVIRAADGTVSRYNDLPDALRQHSGTDGDEWRIHFHLPVFLERTAWSETTRSFIQAVLPLTGQQTLLEIETYTWEALPPELRSGGVTESIIHEIQWLKAALS